MHRLRKRMIEKARNRLADAHRHTARWLCDRFDVVLLPTFRTKWMLKGLENRAARMLASWSHYRFKCLLKHTAEKTGVRVLDVKEHYTSKTCGRCGVLNRKNTEKVFTCASCGLVADRDVHSARNILLRQLHDGVISQMDFCDLA